MDDLKTEEKIDFKWPMENEDNLQEMEKNLENVNIQVGKTYHIYTYFLIYISGLPFLKKFQTIFN